MKNAAHPRKVIDPAANGVGRRIVADQTTIRSFSTDVAPGAAQAVDAAV